MKNVSFPISTSDLAEYLSHRPPMVWVDEVLGCEQKAGGIQGTCRVVLDRDRNFYSEDGSLRASAVVEWIAQAYGYVKASNFHVQGQRDSSIERAFLVAINDCNVDLADIEKERAILVQIKELHNFHPAYVLEGSVTNESGDRIFGKARLMVFGGNISAIESHRKDASPPTQPTP